MRRDAARHWQPARTWAIIIGLLKWKHADMFDTFPTERRRDAELVRCLQKRGVPEAQIVYLQDRQATLAKIEGAITSHLGQAGPDDMVLLYYCGHGYREDDGTPYFACYDAGDDAVPGWAMDSVPEAVARASRGAPMLLAADCCYSGCLADAVARRDSPGHACLTSSSASELSTGNWTFTEGLIAGFEGRAFSDADGDAQITLAELAEQIKADMAFAEEQVASVVIGGGFSPDLTLGPAQRRATADVGRRVEVRSDGDWYKAQIIDADGDRLRVHYYGYERSDDAWVEASQIRDGVTAQYPLGAAVEVRWKGAWYPATIRERRGGMHCIAYDGYGAEWNEWVSTKRIRPTG
jgi:hypothetical protein